MGQFDSFTQSVGDSFVGLIGSVGRNIVCPVGCAVCAVMCILSIIGAISSYNLENGRSSEFWRKCFAAATNGGIPVIPRIEDAIIPASFFFAAS